MPPRTRRATADNSLSVAQTARTEARNEWSNALIDWITTIEMSPANERPAKIAAMRVDMQARNPIYTESLNDADRALLDRVAVIVGNETLDRMAALEALREELKASA